MTEAIEIAAEPATTAVAVRDGAQEVVNATPQQMRVVELSQALEPAYARASTLELTDAEVEALTAPFPDEVVEIRPHDGLIYLPHIHISNRLNKIFKPGKWSLLCRRHWLEGSTMYGEYVLLVRGCFVGESIGGHPYIANNPKQNFSDALESTAAEALRRICGKRLSCGSQVWEPEYARQWVAKHAVQRGNRWERRFTGNHAAPVAPPSQAPESTVLPDEDQQKASAIQRIEEFAAAAGLQVIDVENYLCTKKEIGLPLGGTLADLTLPRLNWLIGDKIWPSIAANSLSLRDASDKLPGIDNPPPKRQEDAEADARNAMGKALSKGADYRIGKVELITKKQGTGSRGPWTLYGVKIDGQFFNSFDHKLGEAAETLEGSPCRYASKPGKNGKGQDLVDIQPA